MPCSRKTRTPSEIFSFCTSSGTPANSERFCAGFSPPSRVMQTWFQPCSASTQPFCAQRATVSSQKTGSTGKPSMSGSSQWGMIPTSGAMPYRSRRFSIRVQFCIFLFSHASSSRMKYVISLPPSSCHFCYDTPKRPAFQALIACPGMEMLPKTHGEIEILEDFVANRPRKFYTAIRKND